MKNLNDLSNKFGQEIQFLTDIQDVLMIKNKYIHHIEVNDMYEKLGTLDNQTKGEIIANIKKYKEDINNITNEKIRLIQSQETKIDCSLMVRKTFGFIHPITVVMNRIRTIMYSLDFHGLRFLEESSNEIEYDFYNFEALNIPKMHPCRNDHQSFFLNNGMILRTQCTATSAHILEKHKTGDGAFFSPGKAYRRDLDATHLPQFYQCDILIMHHKANFQNLLSFIQLFLNTFFGQTLKYRFRPSHFPFTDFSTEVDIWFNGRWLEVLGCGIVNKEVFDVCKSNYRMAFALGMGIERLLMILYSVSDIRSLYSKIDGFAYIGGRDEVKS
jgi:phenylalanyl-tRNA synthetase alpha chain